MKQFSILILSVMLMANSCISTNVQTGGDVPEKNWDAALEAKMSYFGHRNWIVVSDMAYPLQSGAGIITLYADEPYLDVVKKVKKMIDGAPHVFAHIYNDMELGFISEADAPGIDDIRDGLKSICGEERTEVMHEELISRLDAAGKLFNVVIVKTPLTIPYTSTFFELDCNYWSAEKQARLDRAVVSGRTK